MALSGWIYRIATNISRLYWRRHKNRNSVNIEEVNLQSSSEKSSVEQVVDYEQLCQLRLMILELPTKLKQVVVLHYMQHLTIAEAAQALGIKVGTFKSRLNRALKALKNKLD
jgi:RNA polymerase sigma-70 factor (ECF subfamily)